MFKKLLIMFLCLLFSWSFVEAQVTGRVSGRVTDAESGEPLPGANIYLEGTNVGAASGDNGKYFIVNAPPGAQTLVVSYIGYSQKKLSINIIANSTVIQDIKLNSEILTGEEIVVTGIRRGLIRSIATKKQNNVVMDVISGDEMGMLPYQNVGEALRQIPAINTTGTEEEGGFDFVSIRGAAARLNKVNINGQDLASGAETRAVGLDLVPSSMVDGVEVIKTITPDMDGSALGGVINIRTISAFDRDKSFITGKLHGRLYTDQYDFADSRLSFQGNVTAGTRLGEHWGVTASGEVFQQNFNTINVFPRGWTEEEGVWYISDRVRTDLKNHAWRRYSINGSIDFRPNTATRGYLHFNHFQNDNSLAQSQHTFRMRSIVGDEPLDGSPLNVRFTRVRADILVASSSFDNPNTYDREKLTKLTVGGERQFGAFELEAAATYTRGDRNRVKGEYGFQANENVNGFIEIKGNEKDWGDPFRVSVDADPNPFLDPANYEFIDFSPEIDTNDEKSWIGEIQLKWNTNFGYLKTGLKYRNTDKTIDDNNWQMVPIGGLTLADFLDKVPDDLPRGTSGLFQVADVEALEKYCYDNRKNAALFEDNTTLLRNVRGDSKTKESIYAGFLMGSVNFKKLNVTGGVRLEVTNADVTRTVVEDEDGEESWFYDTMPHDIINPLPSLHLTYRQSDRWTFRGSFSTAIARADYEELGARVDLSYLPDPEAPGKYIGEVTEGNPELKPWRTYNFDIGVEYYPRFGGLIGLAAFYKNIKDPIYEEVFMETNTTFQGREYTELEFEKLRNAEEAYVAGLEGTFTLLLPQPLQNFGILSNITLMKSEVTFLRGEEKGKLQMFEQPDLLYTIMPFFQKGKFQTRILIHYQGASLDQLGSNEDLDRYDFERFTVDASVSYKLLSNLTLAIQGRNITNEYIKRQYEGDRSRISRANLYQGSVYLAELVYSL